MTLPFLTSCHRWLTIGQTLYIITQFSVLCLSGVDLSSDITTNQSFNFNVIIATTNQSWNLQVIIACRSKRALGVFPAFCSSLGNYCCSFLLQLGVSVHSNPQSIYLLQGWNKGHAGNEACQSMANSDCITLAQQSTLISSAEKLRSRECQTLTSKQFPKQQNWDKWCIHKF